MKKIIIQLLLLFSLISFTGCSQKEYIYIQPAEFKFKTYEQLQPLNIEVSQTRYNLTSQEFNTCKPSWVDIINQVKPYINTQREIIYGYEGQIKEYNEALIRIKNKIE